MGFFTKDIKSMEDLFLHGLQDVYYAEKQIVKSLPRQRRLLAATDGSHRKLKHDEGLAAAGRPEHKRAGTAINAPTE